MTPVPLELPLRPAEAAGLANLIFDHAEGKPLSDEVRNRLAGRAALLKPQTVTPFFGSLERDPVHHSVYYLAVDGAETPLLLHIALAAAPTSSIYYKPLLIGRMRRPNGAEIVVNAIPFGPEDRASVETFAARINPAFYPQPQGARTTLTVKAGYPEAFDTFRSIRKRTGKNFAAFAGDYHAVLWAAIRAGWRLPYTIAADLTPGDGALAGLAGAECASRFALAIPASEAGLEEVRRAGVQIRNARSAVKTQRAFDLEWSFQEPPELEFLRSALAEARERGYVPQIVGPGPVAGAGLEAMAAAAQQFQVTPGFRYGGEPGETVSAVARAVNGRLDYRVRNAAEAEFVAENLL